MMCWTHAKRLVAVLLAVTALTIGASAPASAHPKREPVPSGLPFTFVGDFRVCDFPVLAEEARPSRLVRKELGNGVFRTTGRLIVRLTNETTGKSIVRDVSGPVFEENNSTRFTLKGKSLINVFVGNDPGGLAPTNPGLFVVKGVVVFDNGVLTKFKGNVENACQTLS